MLQKMAMACFILLAGIPGWCGTFMVGMKDDGSGSSCSPGYWQFNYGVPQYGRTYSVTIEVDNVQEAEERIVRLAADFGATSQVGGYGGYGGHGSAKTKNISFFAKEPKAERFAQKIITEGRLVQYNSSPNMQTTMYEETQRKSEMLSAELKKNGGALERMPIASCILGELREKYENYLRGYVIAKDKAHINVNLKEKAAVKGGGGTAPVRKGQKAARPR